mgnify:CR=1 FL=1
MKSLLKGNLRLKSEMQIKSLNSYVLYHNVSMDILIKSQVKYSNLLWNIQSLSNPLFGTDQGTIYQRS